MRSMLYAPYEAAFVPKLRLPEDPSCTQIPSALASFMPASERALRIYRN